MTRSDVQSDLSDTPAAPPPGRGLAAAALALGFAIGGFFDGILLHQILQWHHLLSGVEDTRLADLRLQILADGLFHLLMYLIGALGLVLLWRSRRDAVSAGAGRRLAGWSLVGFGSWHALDAMLSHWITGIHRIRMDSEIPLAWDVGWLIVFGLVPLAIGLRLKAGRRGGSSTGGGAVAIGLAGATLLAAPVSALPPRDMTGAIVVFRFDARPEDVATAVWRSSGKVVWADRSGSVWALQFDDPTRARALYDHGALFISNSVFPAGCIAWSRATYRNIL